jgi:plasmid maintenance system antidote protein VapI
MSTMHYEVAIRRAIKDRIKYCALTVPEVSKLIGLHKDYLGHVMAHRRNMSLRILVKLAEIFDTTTEQLTREANALMR